MTTDIEATDVGQPSAAVQKKRQVFRRWVLRLTLLVALLGPIIFALAAIGYKLGWFDLGTSFGLLNRNLGPKALGLSLILGLISLALAFLMKPRRKGLGVAALAIVLPVAGMVNLASVKNAAETLPFIHDITTDTQNVPSFSAEMMSRREAVEGVNSTDYIGKMAPATLADGTRGEKLVAALQTKGYPDIRPLVLNEKPDVVFGKAEAIVQDMGWEIVKADAATGIIEATDTTFWYGFEDDVVIRIKPGTGGGSIVDMRSISRVGGTDLGKNADRVRSFLDRLGR